MTLKTPPHWGRLAMDGKKRKMRTMLRLIPVIIVVGIFGYPSDASAHFAAPAKQTNNYRCNEFQGASKTLCMRNQQRVIRCSGLKGIYKRECMEKNEPFRGNGPFRRFSR